jgi:hypothetical protein
MFFSGNERAMGACGGSQLHKSHHIPPVEEAAGGAFNFAYSAFAWFIKVCLWSKSRCAAAAFWVAVIVRW